MGCLARYTRGASTVVGVLKDRSIRDTVFDDADARADLAQFAAQCRVLWAAVLNQAWRDAFNTGRGNDAAQRRVDAQRWFKTRDAMRVVELAGVDAEYFARKYRAQLDALPGLDIEVNPPQVVWSSYGL